MQISRKLFAKSLTKSSLSWHSYLSLLYSPLDKSAKKLYIIDYIYAIYLKFLNGVIKMNFKIKAAALLMAAITMGSSLSALPASAAEQSSANAAYSTASAKAPVAKNTYSSTDKNITISWEKVSGATGYYIYRWSSIAPTWIRIGTASSTASSYTDKKVTASTSYKYYIVAYKKSGSKRKMSCA